MSTSSIRHVKVGMDVVDGSGNEIGHVKALKMGDPDAGSAEGQRMAGPRPLLEDLFGSGPEPRVPQELAERLLRVGYVQIEGKGPSLGDDDVYIAADLIHHVAGGKVHLTDEATR